jgi:cytochrome P450
VSAKPEATSDELVLRDYASVRDGLRKRALKQALYDAGGELKRGVVLTLHCDEHLKRSRNENRLFRRGTFRWYEQELVPKLIEEALAPAVAAGRTDLLELGHRTTMNLTALIGGIDRLRGDEAETDLLHHYVVQFSEAATLAHSKRDHEAVLAEVAEALEQFDRDFFTVSYERRVELVGRFRAGELAEDELPRDVLTALLVSQAELGLGRTDIRREVAFYLQAGSHSSANAFTHAMDDLFTWFVDHPDDRQRVLDDVAFLQRCVHESMRLNPASPVAWRRAVEDAEVAGCPVHVSGKVVLDLRAGNRDEAVFGADAARFNPHRTVPAAVPPWGQTFGGGMHACIGMELDAGVVPRAGDPPEEHVYGTIPLMVRAALRHRARPDPDDPPRRDTESERPHFGRYPILLDPA